MDKRILLVEDNQSDIDLALRAFRKAGVSNPIDIAEDGQEALDYLFCENKYVDRDPSNHPAIVLLDLKLPIVDGLDVLKLIRSTPKLKDLVVVILSSSREEQDIINGYKFGVNSYLTKPLTFENFINTIKQIDNYWLKLNITKSF